MHLQDWEKRLAPHLSRVKLIGEIPLGQGEHAELEEAIGELVCQLGITGATRRLKDEYPVAFITYLSHQAAFNEERGFWDAVAKAMGQTNSVPFFMTAHHWGKTFLEIVEKNGLPIFKGISGMEYVTPIRLHGGISAYSLGDFFRHILLPSLNNPEHSGMEDAAALEHLLQHATVEYFVDDSVRYFFQHGGKTAQAFFSQCRKMARLAMQGEPLPPATELNLQPYVVIAFEHHLQNPTKVTSGKKALRLTFQPHEPAFHLLLPSTPITFEEAGKKYAWQIRCITNGQGTMLGEVPVGVERSRREWQTKESEYLLTEPAEYVQVSLVCRSEGQEEIMGKRSLRLLPMLEELPMLAFRYETGIPRPLTPALPAQIQWLFYPADVALHFDGDAQLAYELHPFGAPWDTWQAQAWDLKNVRLIRLQREGQDICAPVAVTVLYEPELTGQAVHAQSQPVDEIPLFLGVPRLRLPLRHPEKPNEELADWHLRLESHDQAHPRGKWEGRASELTYEMLPKDGCVMVMIAPWLGEKPVGSYVLTARRANESELALPFRTWHEIQVLDLPAYVLPTSQGAEDVRIHVQIPGNCELSATSEATTIHRSIKGWQVTVDAEADQADLELVFPSTPDIVRVPLQLTVPRLRWAVQMDAGSALHWQSNAVRLQIAECLQSKDPRIWMDLPLIGEKTPVLFLHLTVPNSAEPLQTMESRDVRQAHAYHEFRLGGFSETLRANTEESVFELTLELWGFANKEKTRLTILRLNRDLNIDTCHLEPSETGSWRAHWHEPHPLRHRHLRLWSIWQPWADPVDIPIPDDNIPSTLYPESDWWMTNLPNEIGLPFSWYAIQFFAAAPDDMPALTLDPPKGAIQLALIDPQKRLEEIDQELSRHPQFGFRLHAEKACIYDSLGMESERNQEIKECNSHWNEAYLSHVLGFQHWLSQRDPLTSRAFLMHMFRQESLEKLRTCPAETIQRYLGLITEAKTIKPDHAWIILKMAKNPDVLYKALTFLIQAKDPKAVDYIMEEIQAGRFSCKDAAQVLLKEPGFSVQELQKRKDIPVCDQLLLALSRDFPIPELAIWKGYWVHSVAGWGVIVEIEGAAREDVFLPGKETPDLFVALRGGDVIVRINTSKKNIHFIDRKSAYLCRCKRFIVPGGIEFRQVWEQHGKFCKLTGDPDLQFLPYQYEGTLAFSAIAPENMYSIPE